MRFLVLFLVVLGTFQPAWADDREDASKEFQAGAAADKDHDYRNAIDHYRRAFDILPHQFAAYNIATDFEHLNDIKNAVIWYQKFLQLDSTSADAQKVRQHLNDLSAKSGPIKITSNPSGGRVLVDGSPAGSTPITVQVKGGSHRITLEQDGKHQDKVVTTEYGIPAEVSFSLVTANGTLIVYGSPPGATVYIDDSPAGSLPFQAPLPAGEHTMRVQAVGYTELSQNVTVPANSVARLPVHLVRGTGSVDGNTTNPGDPNDPNPGVQYGYLLGVTGGADAANAGATFTFDFGVRVFSFDGAIQVGKTDGNTYIGFIGRYSLSKKKVQPFLGVGYFVFSEADDFTTGDGTSTSTSGSGGGVQAGIRWDLTKGPTTNMAVRATVGVDYITDGAGNGRAVVPVTVSLEAVIGKQAR